MTLAIIGLSAIVILGIWKMRKPSKNTGSTGGRDIERSGKDDYQTDLKRED